MSMSGAPGRSALHPDIVGVSVDPVEQVIDARWLMAYAAGLGETDPRYFDTAAPAGPAAHPVFPVCYEWPVALAVREKTIGLEIARLSVHSTHDLVIHRPPRAGDRLVTRGTVAGLEPHRAGALVTVRHETVDASGQPVTTTSYGSLYRGVSVEGAREPTRPAASSTAGRIRWEETVNVPAQAAHVYTECARIWNPIHTDIAAARAAGLPDLILHGTANLALAVSRVVARDLGGDPARVRGVRVRFTGMVPMPSTFVVRARVTEGGRLPFDAVNLAGQSVLSAGEVRS
jgi:acyl dehydratase